MIKTQDIYTGGEYKIQKAIGRWDCLHFSYISLLSLPIKSLRDLAKPYLTGRFSRWNAILFYALFIMVVFLFRNNVFKKVSYIYGDPEGYYAYLPKWFIYDDYLKMPNKTKGRYLKNKGTEYFNKYSSGVAILQMPFFLVAHAQASISSDLHASGYSKIYDKAILVATATYVFLGLFFLFKTLRLLLVSRWLSCFLVFTVYFGTNLMYYTMMESGMSHSYSFGLISIFVYLSFRYKSDLFSVKPLALGILMGLIALIRVSNLLIVLCPLVYVLAEYNTFSAFLGWIKKNILNFILIAIPIVALFVFQVFQWYDMTGRIILSGYSETDAGLIYLKSPKFLRVFFDIKNGWFVYSPIMFISMISMFVIFKDNKKVMLSVLLPFLMVWYIVASWWAWHFAGAFGHRAFIDFLSLCIIPLALFLSRLEKSGYSILFKTYIVLISILIYVEYGMALSYEWPWEPPKWTWAKYWEMLKDVAMFKI